MNIAVSHKLVSILAVMTSAFLIMNTSAPTAGATVISSSNCVPPIGSQYSASQVAGFHQGWPVGAGTITFSNSIHNQFSGCTTPNAATPGALTIDTFSSTLSGTLIDLGGVSHSITVPDTMVTVQLIFTGMQGQTQLFDTTITQFDVSGGNLPAGVMLRQSLSKPTLGKTTITPIGNQFQISSFFDVFTDLSIDGGTTWIPSTIGGHVEVVPEPLTTWMIGVGAGTLIALARRRRNQ